MDVQTAEEAVARIPDGATVVVAGNGSLLQPEALLSALERVFLTRGHPRGLTVVYPVVVGTRPGDGIDHLAHPGLVQGVVASCFEIWGVNRLARLVREGAVHAHCLPMGVLFQLLHAAADGQPAILSRVGLGTFVDPALRGTAQNTATSGSWAQRVELDGQPYLLYRAPAVDAALLRATVADEDGNLGLQHEPIRQAVLTMALAARARGGLVLAQVRAVVRRHSLPPAVVEVPGCLVDAVVVDPDQRQSAAAGYEPGFSGEWAVLPAAAPLPLGPEKVMARRAALALPPRGIVNLGFGLPTLVAQVAAEEGLADGVSFSVEHGPLGGLPAGPQTFGAAWGPRCLLRSTDVFALYHSGRLDLAILSAAEVDAAGNTNVSRFADAMPGPGGYIDIAATSRRLIFLCALTAGGTQLAVGPDGLAVVREGRIPRYVPRVQECTFSAQAALQRGAEVLYVADRCAFRLTPEGLTLVEVAPGIDPAREVGGVMTFQPRRAEELRPWPAVLFSPGPMGAGAARALGVP